MEGKPHAVVIPFPAQGHVIPLLELSYCLVERGFHVTFVNNEYTHRQITSTLPATHDCIQMVAVSDGMAIEDRHNIGKHCESMLSTMSGNLAELLGKLNQSEAEKVACVVTDGAMAWSVPVAKKAGVPRTVVLWTVAAAVPALGESFPTLIESNIIDDNGYNFSHDFTALVTIKDILMVFLWHRFCSSPPDCNVVGNDATHEHKELSLGVLPRGDATG